jgi:hypothetical protein
VASRRDLKTFACGIAHKFACSAQHYAWLAHHHDIQQVTIDLLTLHIEPAEFDIERNRILAGYCKENLLYLLNKWHHGTTVSTAVLIADFGIDDFRVDDRFGPCIGESIFTVILIDDCGKKWIGVHRDALVLAQE